MKVYIKNTINIILISIMFTSCNQIDVDTSNNIDHIMIEKHVQSDSTIIIDDYPIVKKGSCDYIFNSKRELIAIYDTSYTNFVSSYVILFSYVILLSIIVVLLSIIFKWEL